MKEKMQQIQTEQAPQAIGPYSQAIQTNKNTTIYFSGQIPLDPKTMNMVSDDFRAQANQVFTNLEKVAQAAGGNLDDVLKLTIYLTDLNDFKVVNEVMLQYFKEPYPARTTIQVVALPKAAKIEIDAIMAL
jgi:reactive intermediate/imine deaminase